MTVITTDLILISKALIAHQIVAIPTETVYGIAANAYSDIAIKKIFELKKRPLFNPLIVHIKSILELDNIAKDIPKAAFALAEMFWPGSLTLVLNKQKHISSLITGGKNTVAVRVPNHSLTLALLNELDFPLVAPSANPFTQVSSTQAMQVYQYFKDELPFILDGGTCKSGVESTIIGFDNDQPVLYRHGALSIEEIEAVVGKIKTAVNHKKQSPNAPGMLLKHYSPHTKLVLCTDPDKLIGVLTKQRIGLLLFNRSSDSKIVEKQIILSTKGDLKEAANKLYTTLQELDQLGLDLIIAQKFPDYGLGRTINDRLERAAAL